MIPAYFLIPAAIVITFFGAVGAFFFKKASTNFSIHPLKLIKNYYFILAAVIYTLASVAYVIVLKYEDLIVLYPLGSLQYIWAAFLATWLLKEKLTKNKISGIFLIMIGVTIISVFR